MSAKHYRQTTLKCRFLLSAAIVIIFLSPAIFFANESADTDSVQYNRADADTIKILTRQILSIKDFAPRKTFQQWLIEKLTKWDLPKLEFSHGWVAVVCWIILIWCILTLIAIFIHFIYTITLLIRPAAVSSDAGRNISSKSVKITSFTELYKMAQEFAGNGAFREAVSTISAALLYWLDSVNIVSFHESKTNGDYIREYPSDYTGRDAFRKFICISEQNIYGSLRSDNQTYNQMNSLMEHIQNCVARQTKE
ncbi:MAG: hypothetical protein JW787_01340 [Sedimentisphaerales bacterium]|nr:hypothetical protein [Sedimentisphaerales bacterium]